jgi:putative transposase
MAIRPELLDELLKECENPEELLGQNGLLKELTKGLVERMLHAEMTDHLGYEKHAPEGHHSGNSRNGTSPKKLKTEHGEMPLEIPRDRNGSFDPKIVRKGQTRFDGFDDKILSMYARGMTTGEIRGHLEEMYGVEVTASFISDVTDAVLDEVKTWQARPLDAVYPILYLDALVVKVRTDGSIRNQAVYLALGVNIEGEKELLGLWMSPNEGAKFWLQVLTELKNRGLQDIFIACVDGLSGFPDALATVFPHAQVQLCIVHMVRNSLKYVTWKERKAVAADLKTIYQATTLDQAGLALDAFCQTWDDKYPTIGKAWRRDWDQLTPFFEYPNDIRRVIYTTNAIESINRSFRKILKNRGAFPTEQAVFKLMYMALQNIAKKWTMPIRNWKAALNRFAIMFEGRLP